MDDRKKTLSRRNFLRAASAGAGLAVLAACGGAPATTQPTAAPAATLPPPTTAPTLVSVVEQATAAPTAVPEPTAAPAAETVTTLNGIALPADAAPSEQQVYVRYFDNTATFTTIDFMVSVYNGGGNALRDLLSDSLIR
ncbi:MAG: hypothetical protein RLZZ387_2766, partial [Chloroflexota bacterium]